ncbi:sentrin-specific protease 6-like [Podarcis raffonei]|uniref:sentrin-specific protease 6-like n=1 Tax=Podarcis raffonei TaxID=65483 RepID=UPI00232931F0|nr:sentrin-specific protease 6-like [Podarcis raffonei]
MPKRKKKRSENVQNAPCSATVEQASCHPGTNAKTTVVKTAAQRKQCPPKIKKTRSTVCPRTTKAPEDNWRGATASKLNDQTSIFSGGEEKDKAGSSNRTEKSRKASRKRPHDKCVLKAQVKHRKALSKKTDAEPLHQKSYQRYKLDCGKIIVGALKRTLVETVTVSFNSIKINLEKGPRGIRLKAAEITKWTYGFARNQFVSFLRTTAAAYQKLESQMKGNRKEANVWKCRNATNPKEREIILIVDFCYDPDTFSIIEAMISNIGDTNNIPDFCVKMTSKKVNSVLEAFQKPLEGTSRRKKTKLIPKSKRQLQNKTQYQVLDDSDESESDSTQRIVYPPPPALGGIAVTNKDLQCLDEGEYLNDAIIDFYLKYLVLEKLKKEDAERTHVFSCFFYTFLSEKESRNFPETSQLTIEQQWQRRVKGWTQDVDIFEKDFVFVPINEDEHWVLAVICFPGLMQPVYERNPYSKKVKFSAICKQPCILLMNSFRGPFPSHIFQILQEWLELEWEVRRGTKRSFSEHVVRCLYLEVPQQNNNSDCGIYVLQYAESFFETPILSFDTPMNLTDWFPDSRVENKREEIRNLILSLQ